MKLVIEIDMSGPAFRKNADSAPHEVARILKGIAHAADEYGMLGEMEFVDSTGRDCGKMVEVAS